MLLEPSSEPTAGAKAPLLPSPVLLPSPLALEEPTSKTELQGDMVTMASDHRWEVVLKMLKKGADPNQTDKLGQTTLFHAAKYGRLSLVHQLVVHRADPNQRSGTTKQSALHCAVMFGTSRIVQALLEAGSKPDMGNLAGDTPIQLARQLGQETMLRLLLESARQGPAGASTQAVVAEARAAEVGDAEASERACGTDLGEAEAAEPEEPVSMGVHVAKASEGACYIPPAQRAEVQGAFLTGP